MIVKHRYFLKIMDGPEREVTERQYREAEFNYGFDVPSPSFTCEAAQGRIKTEIVE